MHVTTFILRYPHVLYQMNDEQVRNCLATGSKYILAQDIETALFFTDTALSFRGLKRKYRMVAVGLRMQAEVIRKRVPNATF